MWALHCHFDRIFYLVTVYNHFSKSARDAKAVIEALHKSRTTRKTTHKGNRAAMVRIRRESVAGDEVFLTWICVEVTETRTPRSTASKITNECK